MHPAPSAESAMETALLMITQQNNKLITLEAELADTRKEVASLTAQLQQLRSP